MDSQYLQRLWLLLTSKNRKARIVAYIAIAPLVISVLLPIVTNQNKTLTEKITDIATMISGAIGVVLASAIDPSKIITASSDRENDLDGDLDGDDIKKHSGENMDSSGQSKK